MPKPFRVEEAQPAARDSELALGDYIEWTDSDDDRELAVAAIPADVGGATAAGNAAETAAAASAAQAGGAPGDGDHTDEEAEDAALAAVVLPAAAPAQRYVVLQGSGAAPQPQMPARVYAAWATERARRRAAEAEWASFVATGALSRGAMWQWTTVLPGRRS